MDGSLSVEKAARSSVTLPSRYLEELDNCSSPGVVSKKAAFFEEVIRSASGEKKCSGSQRRTGTGPRSMSRIIDEVELGGMKDSTVKTLDFSSDSEGSGNEVENRPPEVNKLIPEEALVVEQQQPSSQTKAADNEAQTKVVDFETQCETKVTEIENDETVLPNETKVTEIENDETVLPNETKVTAVENDETVLLNETGTSLQEASPVEEIKVVVTGCTQVQFSSPEEAAEIDGTGLIGQEDDGGLSGSSDVSEPQQEVLKEGKDVDCERPEQVLPPPSVLRREKAGKPQQAQKTSGAKAREIGSQRGKAPAAVRSSSAGSFHAKRGEAVRNSVSELGSTKRAGSRRLDSVSKSASFTTPQPFTLATEKRHLNSGESKTKQVSTKQPPSTSKDAPRRSVSEFHLKSEERAEKRKEFYLRLEERMSAKEQEKSQMKVKNQEAMDSELRKMRQSLTFKAKPMPSFYHESPASLKKAQSTRPVSPKLGRPKVDSSGPASIHHHNVRLCQQHQRPGKPPVVTSGRLSDARSSRTGKLLVDSPVRVGEAGSKETSPESSLAGKDSKSQVVGVMEDCSSILDLKEEDETLLLA